MLFSILKVLLISFLVISNIAWAQDFKVDEKIYCGIIQQCGLPRPSLCEAKNWNKKPNPITKKNKEKYCANINHLYEIKNFNPSQIQSKIFVTSHAISHYSFHEFSDKLDISKDKFVFLLNNIDLAVKIINVIKDESYHIDYLDSPANTIFKGTNNRDIKGWASLLVKEKSNLYYFGSSTMNSVGLTIKGKAYFDLFYQEIEENTIFYKLAITTFVENSFINFLMDSFILRNILRKKCLEIIDDIALSANKINKENFPEIIKNYNWSQAEKEKLNLLLNL